MKFSISQQSFLEGVQIVQRAISTKSVLPPILSGIYMESKGHSIILKATDLEIGIECILDADVVEEGMTVLPARYFVELVKKLPNTKIELETLDNEQLRIIYGQSEVILNTFDADEFPPLQQFDKAKVIKLDKQTLVESIKNVSIAASSDYSRPIFTGILMEITDTQHLKLVATDTHRLAYTEIKLPGDVAEVASSMIIPSRSLIEISRVASFDGDEVSIYMDKNKVLFSMDNMNITSRLIEGKFVNYKQVIPKEHTSQVRVLKKSLFDSLERASLLSRDDLSKRKHNTVKLSLEEGHMKISSKSSQIGSLEETVPIHLEGKPLEIGFNAKYLLDVLRVIDTEEVIIDLTTELSPGIIRPGKTEQETLFLVLPIRLNQ